MNKAANRQHASQDQIKAVLKNSYKITGSEDYEINTGLLWDSLRYMVTHPPAEVDKWTGVRWLMSELAQFAQRDFQE